MTSILGSIDTWSSLEVDEALGDEDDVEVGDALAVFVTVAVGLDVLADGADDGEDISAAHTTQCFAIIHPSSAANKITTRL